ncbi:TetR family transcriptional regulator [Collimonas pratensis]|uniref:TetR/AcrR family transcriptional regulator n=1 Tax=Collimonas pratensis TaxID=279113 RepID=UPI00143DB6AD|nr:TetR/AcrR family transcriptional regulator [Collimonas pratensis]NKI70918.1 TetR family transcriptional regulator [Collimonas pratensis]
MSTVPRLTDRKREAIVQAAIAEFRSNGFETTSMDKIAARAEVSKRTVYNHFPGKEELFAEILTRLWQTSEEQSALCYRPGKPLRGQLRELLQSKMRMLNDSNFLDLARVAIAAAIHSPERTQDMLARMGQREEGVNTWIVAAQADGRLKAVDPAFAAHQLQSLLKTFAFWPQITLGQPPLSAKMQQEVVDSAVDMFLAYYQLPAER